MQRHSWKKTGDMPSRRDSFAADPDCPIERCAHCRTERVRDGDATSLWLYRGGNATVRGKALSQDGKWDAFISGVIPQCVER